MKVQNWYSNIAHILLSPLGIILKQFLGSIPNWISTLKSCISESIYVNDIKSGK